MRPNNNSNYRGEGGFIAAEDLDRVLNFFRAFFWWPVIIVGSILLHHFMALSIPIVAAIGVIAIVMSVFVWFVGKEHPDLGIWHMIVTALVTGTIFGMVDMMGWNKITFFAVFAVVPVLCFSWSLRNSMQTRHQIAAGQLDALFDDAGLGGTHMEIHKPKKVKNKTSGWRDVFKGIKSKDEEPKPDDGAADGPPLEGKQRRNKIERKLRATLHLNPGDTVDDVKKQLKRVESAAGWPPGAMLVSEHIHHAGKADVILSDPRSIREPALWPGPSYINGSIADPISVGLYQTGSEVELVLPETQMQIMGQVGAGKSLGAGWGAMAEIITRRDAVIWAIDIKKGLQTLGPLAPALHRFATTDDDALSILTDVNSLISPRTNYLQSIGLTKWQPDCGLNYLFVWTEETPYLFSSLGRRGGKLFVDAIKSARSAGITFVWSLQRADFKEIPTIIRGQGGIKWCFGLADQKDSQFGLTKAQLDGGCTPEKWGQRQPGMFYLDAPSIPEATTLTAGRTWYWGKPGEDAERLAEHAANFPIADRPYDQLMIDVLNGDVKPEEPKPEYESKRIPAKAKAVPKAAEKISPEAARKIAHQWLVNHKGQSIRASQMIADVCPDTGYSRTWVHKVLNEYASVNDVQKITVGEGDDREVIWKISDELSD